MKKFYICCVAFVMAVMCTMICGCEKQSVSDQRIEGDYKYQIVVEVRNQSNSTIGAFFELMVNLGNGNYENWSQTYHGVLADTDALAIAQFNAMLAKINDDEVCSTLYKADYMKGVLQRVEGRVTYNLKGKLWTANGVQDL